MAVKSLFHFVSAALVTVLMTAPGLAQTQGRPVDGQLGFQPAASPVMEQLNNFHNFLLVIIVGITLLVFALLGYCIVRFNRRANPTASKVSHNTLIEIVWTGIPVLILIFIAVPSFNLLYYQELTPEPDLVIEATGYQWYWGYEYPEQDNGEGGVTVDTAFGFDGIMLDKGLFGPGADQAARGQAVGELRDFLNQDSDPEIYRLLDTDTRIVVPVNKTVKVLVTSADVLHSFTIPAFGFKMDAVPGRFNETWFKATETGTFYGQCSELCGIKHAFMPIVVEVVTDAEFAAWMDRTKLEYALNDDGVRYAAAD